MVKLWLFYFYFIVMILSTSINLLYIAEGFGIDFLESRSVYSVTLTGGTEVFGYIKEDTNWNIKGSPYIFTCDVEVENGATLTIEPGVTVDLTFYVLKIKNGTLSARGNETHRIKFLGTYPESSHPRIFFDTLSRTWDEATGTGCIIEYAEIRCEGYQYSIIDTSQYAMAGSPKISNNLIYNSGEISAVNIRREGVVSNNTITGGYCGVSSSGGAFVSDNYIYGTKRGIILGGYSGSGIFSGVVTKNVITNNHEGVAFYGSPSGYVANNTIIGNEYGLKFAYDYEGTSKIVYNNIYGNTKYDVLVEAKHPAKTIDIPNNWWGTTDTSLIDQKIYDQKDDYRLSFVNYTPILTAPAVSPDVIPPTTSHDYDGLWHITDFAITLTATDDISGVTETYYKINNGPTKTVSANGQPLITMESANNKLEYWSVDSAGNEELPHKILTGIKLDKTAPTGSIIINNGDAYTTSTSVTLTLTETDLTSGVYQVRYSNDGVWDTEPWETPSPTKTWTLTSGDGTKTVYYQIKDNAGLVSITYSDAIILDTAPPIANAGNDQTVNIGATVTFDAGGSTDNVGIVSYEWNFGDGTTGAGVTANHTYTSPGTYTVKLTVKDAAGNIDTHSITITVEAPPAEAFPMWVIGAAAAIATTGIAVAATILWKKRK